MISETMPLNQWPVDKLYYLKYMVLHSSKSISPENYKTEILEAIDAAIKDAEQELSQLPFDTK